MGSPRTLALGALLLAQGGIEPRDLQRIVGLLRAGDGEAAARDLEKEAVREALRTSPGALDEVCAFGASSARAVARKSPAAAPRVAAALLALSTGCREAFPNDFLAARARLHALLADGRIRLELGQPVAADPFVEAGEGLEKMHEARPKDGIHLLAAARAFADGAEAAGAKGPALFDRAEGLATRIRLEHRGTPEAIAGAIGVLLDRIRWGGTRKEKGLDGRLDRALEYLAEARKAAPGEDLDLLAVHTDAVSLARTLGIRRPGLEYETEPANPCSGILIAAPRGRRWSTREGAKVQQIDRDLGPVRRIEFTSYSWEQEYPLPDGSLVKGDSMKDLAGRFLDIAAKDLKKIRSRRPVVQGRLRRCEPGWVFEVSGTDGKGAYVRRREWFFKSGTGKRETFRVAVLDLLPDLEEDPAFASVMESVRESGR